MGQIYIDKKIRRLVMLAVILLLIRPAFASADMGPKPYVKISFQGMQDRTYYVTLLSEQESGPWNFVTRMSDFSKPENIDVYRKFIDFSTPDGYHLLDKIVKCTDNQTFEWTYYPPSRFYILIYLPDQDRFILSQKPYERYAFHTYYEIDYNQIIQSDEQGISTCTAEVTYPYAKEVLALVIRIVLTLLIEIRIAYFFGYKKPRQWSIILVTNIVTQLVFNLGLNITAYKEGMLYAMILFAGYELLIIIAEAITYSVSFIKIQDNYGLKKGYPILYAITANIVSMAAGYVLADKLPILF